jgi:uncharacterized protein (TIGR03083 family)
VQHWDAIANERRTFADEIERFTPDQWESPSLCGNWTARQVVGHLIVPHETPRARVLLEIARDRGNFNRANSRLAVQVGARPTMDLVSALRRHAESQFTPPGFGSVAPLTDLLIHGLDIGIPLGLPPQRSPEAFRHSLDFLVRPAVQLAFFRKRAPLVRVVATDLDWSHGSGDEVTGSAADLALALSHRRARLDALGGSGAHAMIAWVS